MPSIILTLPRRFISVRGRDRASFLHNVVTHDIKGLPVGQGKPACLLDRQGKVQASLLAHSFPEEIVLEMEPSDAQSAMETLKKYLISEAAELSEKSGVAVLALHGQEIGTLVSLPPQNLQHAAGPEGSGILQVVRWDLFGMPGAHLWVEPAREAEIRKSFEQKGLASGDLQAFHALRIEAGVPWPGIDITPAVILNELGSEEMVSFTKGCYIGQEIVARIKYRAHPPRLLRKFSIEGTAPKTPCSLLQAGKPVGTLTSASGSLGLGFLGYDAPLEGLQLENGVKVGVRP
jgi:folate-binding protein YgfZ